MARKKEPERIDRNREHLITIAKGLFQKEGIERTKIDDVAKAAGMSKSTLYVYFKSKDEIRYCISLEAMQYLLKCLKETIPLSCIQDKGTLHDRYLAICHILVNFKRSYPLDFELLIQEIKIDAKSMEENPILKEIYDCGEQINQYVAQVLQDEKIENSSANMIANIFIQWGSICGLINLADNKEKYILQNTHLTKQEFLEQGFEQLFSAIPK